MPPTKTAGDRQLEITMALARLLRQARARAGLTLDQVARATGISGSQIHRLETGFIASPSLVEIVILVQYFRIPMREVLREIGMPDPVPSQGPEVETERVSPKVAQLQMMVDTATASATEEQLDYLLTFVRSFLKLLGSNTPG